jgi:hypothetical protein
VADQLRMRFGNLTRNERYRRRLNSFISDDGNASDVTVLASFDEVDAVAAASDRSANEHTLVFGNDAIITDAVVKFAGTTSLIVDGASPAGYVDIAETADGVLGREGPTDFADGDFTIELHLYAISSIGADQIFLTYPDGEDHIGLLMSNNNLFIEHSTDGTTTVQTDSGHNLSDATWQHLALVRSGNDLDLYMDGTVGTTTVDVTGLSLHALTTSALFRLGANTAASVGFHGYVANLRITKGVARYTTDFTPPTEAYPAVTQ